MEIPQLPASAVVNASSSSPSSRDEATIRKMATEFEALLLNQLTATLSKTEDDEGGLFGNSGGGMSLSRQLFSEQLAKTMAQNGGIGLADLILQQVRQKSEPVKQQTLKPLTRPTSMPIAPAETNRSATQPVVQDKGRFIASEAALATRPRRVHPVRTETPVRTSPAEGPRPLLPGTGTNEIHRTPVLLKLPIRGAIRSVFGPRRDPINGRPRFHKGIDIAAPQGAPIQASAAGTVVFAGRNGGYGNMVMLEHADGRRTLYAHAEALFVKVGDRVSASQTIAAVGSTGHSTGPHVHFEVRVGDQAVNPFSALANDFVATRR